MSYNFHIYSLHAAHYQQIDYLCFSFFQPSRGAGTASRGHNEGEEMAQPSTTNTGGGENPQLGRGHNEGEKSAQPSTTNSGGGDNPQPTNSVVF